MFRLRNAYLIFSAVLIAAFHLLYSKGLIDCAAANILLLVLAPLGYVYPKAVAFALIGLSAFAAYPALVLLYKAGPLDSLLTILVFDGLQLGFIAYKEIVGREREDFDSELKAIEKDKDGLLEEFNRLDASENRIKTKETATVNLYEITKKMTEDLRFEDIFRAFGDFLKENLTFRRCDLLILAGSGTSARLDRAFSVWRDPEKKRSAQGCDYEKLIRTVLADEAPVCFSRREDPARLRDLGVEDESVETLVSVPLKSGKRTVAMISVQDLPESERERLYILSTQLALEIRKVLLYETVETLAITDSLTGLYVRRYFMERMQEELQRSKRHAFKFAFLMADIDDFKRCNDTHGHLVGDVVLKGIGRIMRESVREIDLVARYGGEEFALLLPETDTDGARLVAERIRKRIEENAFKAYDEKVRITVSIGISVYPRDGNETKEVIGRSDHALYKAKRSGKNIVCEYSK